MRLYPLFVTLTESESVSAMNGRSKKRMCVSAWKKCSTRVTEYMVELLDSPFQLWQMDAKFDAFEKLFIRIYGGGQVSSINQVRKTIFCQRNQNVEMIPHHRMPYSKIVGGQCSRQVYGRRSMTQLWSNLIRVFMVGTENTITSFLSG